MKSLGAGQNLNVRFTERLLAQIDARVAELSARTPGATFTRSDVIRMAVEEFTRGSSAAAKPEKTKRPLAKAGAK